MMVAVMFPPAGTLVLLTLKSTVGTAGVTWGIGSARLCKELCGVVRK